MAQIQFSSIKKIKIGRPEHSLPPTPLCPITSHFCLNPTPHPPHPPPQKKMDVICVSPLSLFQVANDFSETNDKPFQIFRPLNGGRDYAVHNTS